MATWPNRGGRNSFQIRGCPKCHPVGMQYTQANKTHLAALGFTTHSYWQMSEITYRWLFVNAGCPLLLHTHTHTHTRTHARTHTRTHTQAYSQTWRAMDDGQAVCHGQFDRFQLGRIANGQFSTVGNDDLVVFILPAKLSVIRIWNQNPIFTVNSLSFIIDSADNLWNRKLVTEWVLQVEQSCWQC